MNAISVETVGRRLFGSVGLAWLHTVTGVTFDGWRRFTRNYTHAILMGALLAVAPGAAVVRGQSELEKLKVRAAQGEAEALNALGTVHANGQGVSQNYSEALSLYQQAADRGLASAWFNLGMFYELGRGVVPDSTKAFECYLKAAQRGFAPAQFNVGNMYANGVGVKEDLFEAALWFHQAADRGVPEAQFNLGLAYELGRGLRSDESKALQWYQTAAAQGNARAQFNLALMLEEGRGAPADPAAAMELYRRAAKQNFAPAQNNLGILLAEGRGAPADLVEAYNWLTLAGENGVASNIREIVVRQLTPEALATANASLAEMRSQLVVTELPSAVPVVSKLADSAPAPLAVADVPVSSELSTLQYRLATAEAESKSIRAQNAQFAEAMRAAEQMRMTLEQRLAASEESARLARIAASDAEMARSRSTVATTSIDLESLAAADSRIANLMRENVRLNDEMNLAKLELAQMRMAQATVGAGDGSERDNETVIELERRVTVLRRTVDKLAEESRWNAGASADLSRLRMENQQLKSARGSIR